MKKSFKNETIAHKTLKTLKNSKRYYTLLYLKKQTRKLQKNTTFEQRHREKKVLLELLLRELKIETKL